MIRIYTDGASQGNPGKSASGWAIYNDGKLIKEGIAYNGIKTNNYAEYMAMILALEWCSKNISSSEKIEIYSDSRLATMQASGKFKVKSASLQELNSRLMGLAKKFREVKFINVPRENANIAKVDAALSIYLSKQRI
ncbi:MAG: ribonuclease HI family protein [Candidatus Micrarchaeaceae archaeon]